MYQIRSIDKYLERWKNTKSRKVLLVRGVRQCGKTSSIRNLGRSFKYYVELNLESEKDICTIFQGPIDIDRITKALEVRSSTPIRDGETLLFIDEIQQSKEAIESLRFFHEKRPELHVVAAGSLLELALESLSSFGVGRVESLFMHPLSFMEFLHFSGEDILRDAIEEGSTTNPLDETIHQKALLLFKDFILTGGFPEAVCTYIEEKSFLESRKVIDALSTSFQDDFAKYGKKVPESMLSEVLSLSIALAGKEIKKGTNALPYKWSTIADVLYILEKISLIIPVYASQCSSLPIGADSAKTLFKLLPCDTGLYLSEAGLDLSSFVVESDFRKLNIGNLMETAAGLEILKSGNPTKHPELYFWKRSSSKDNHGISEVDYVVQKNTNLIPIEIKGRVQGGMKSMWLYLEKGVSEYGIRSSFENFSEYDRIKVIPIYALGSYLKKL